jgi:hypothetical protein
MYIFVIDEENRVTAHAVTKALNIPKGQFKFADPKELARLAAGWPATRLVEIWNNLANSKKVLRFADRNAAIQRIWKVVQKMAASPPAQVHKARDGMKGARIIALLKRPSGATLVEIMTETGWQAHSVRGFISGQLTRRLGLRVKSFKRKGERTYRIVKGEIA